MSSSTKSYLVMKSKPSHLIIGVNACTGTFAILQVIVNSCIMGDKNWNGSLSHHPRRENAVQKKR